MICIACRLPEVHGCSRDFVSDGKLQLEKQNPTVVREKVDKI